MTDPEHSGCNGIISKAPPEILTMILRYARYTEGRRNFLSCFLVCYRSLVVSHRLAWDSIALDSSSLESFIGLAGHAPDGCRSVRSLSLQLYTVWPPLDKCRIRNAGSPDPQPDGPNPEMAKLRDQLGRLVEIVGSHMVGLVTFSLRMDKYSAGGPRQEYHRVQPPGAWMKSSIIARLLGALPQSCIDLELDTQGRDDDPRCHFHPKFGSAHLYDTIRILLPRLRHLRLRLGSLCPDFFSHTANGVRSSITALQLESMLVNLKNGRLFDPPRVCKVSQWTHPCLFWKVPKERVTCHKACLRIKLCKTVQTAYHGNSFPRATTIRIMDLESLAMPEYEHFIQYDITTSQTYFIPFSLIFREDRTYDYPNFSYRTHDYRNYLLRDKSDNEFVGSFNAIEDTLEHESEVWSTTSEGDRWTTHSGLLSFAMLPPSNQHKLRRGLDFRELYHCNSDLHEGSTLKLDEAKTRLSWTKDGTHW